MLYYSKSNLWIDVSEGFARIGLAPAAQEHLGDVTFVDLPPVTAEIAREHTLCTVESVKAVMDLYAPVGLKITNLNAVLEEHPETLNHPDWRQAWLLEGSLDDARELEELMSPEAYEAYLKGSSA